MNSDILALGILKVWFAFSFGVALLMTMIGVTDHLLKRFNLRGSSMTRVGLDSPDREGGYMAEIKDEAYRKIVSKVFSSKTPDQLRIRSETERRLPGSEFYKTVGSIEYDINTEPPHSIRISHDGGRQFTVFISAHESDKHPARTISAIPSDFGKLGDTVAKAIGLLLNIETKDDA